MGKTLTKEEYETMRDCSNADVNVCCQCSLFDDCEFKKTLPLGYLIVPMLAIAFTFLLVVIRL